MVTQPLRKTTVTLRNVLKTIKRLDPFDMIYDILFPNSNATWNDFVD